MVLPRAVSIRRKHEEMRALVGISANYCLYVHWQSSSFCASLVHYDQVGGENGCQNSANGRPTNSEKYPLRRKCKQELSCSFRNLEDVPLVDLPDFRHSRFIRMTRLVPPKGTLTCDLTNALTNGKRLRRKNRFLLHVNTSPSCCRRYLPAVRCDERPYSVH